MTSSSAPYMQGFTPGRLTMLQTRWGITITVGRDDAAIGRLVDLRCGPCDAGPAPDDWRLSDGPLELLSASCGSVTTVRSTAPVRGSTRHR